MDAAAELSTLSRFIPTDRAHAMATGRNVPERARGIVLFADIGGFTPLAESMERALGTQHGAGELAAWLDRTFGALAEAVDRHRGSIVSFAGDAITCWFDWDHRLGAVAAALEMQVGMAAATPAPGAGGTSYRPTLKVSLAGGETRRFVVGDPEIQVFDVLSGAVVDRAGAGEKHCGPGEVTLDAETATALGEAIATTAGEDGFVHVTGLAAPVEPDPWPELPEGAILDWTARSWIAPAVYERLQTGHARFVAEFRSVVIEFVSFGGIDYDDEQAGPELDALLRRTQDVVARNGGSVFDVSMGDKGSYLLSVFGAPVTHGDDARRAATAADELRRTAGEGIRIGVHTGHVYAGLYRGRFRSTYTVAGDAVNLAARLMTSATPGQVLMSAPVGAALDRRFVIHPIDPIEVKGRAAPVAVCELVGTVASGESLGEPRYPLPMVGREREREAIDEALDAVAGGRGGVLAFSADAGMGKSRLVSTTIRRARDRGIGTFVGECQPHGGRLAYLPWHRVWSALLGLPADAPPDAQREALVGGLGAVAPNLVPLAPLLGAVLDLPIPDNDATRSMPAIVRKQVLEQVLTGLLRGRASAGPVCIALEDLHWMDGLSRDLLAALAPAIADVPVLIVLSYRRPDDGPPIALAPGSEHVLGELSPGEASELATMLLTHVTEAVPDAATVEAVTERANGNPFFIEELVREIGERGGSTSDLPTSLENLILERIDRLTPGQKLTARVASVVGRRFSTAWLTDAFAGTIDPARLDEDLAGLVASGLIVEDTPAPDETHLFRHVVVRDVAYETLGFHVRRDLHEQLAAYLEAAPDSPPALVAYHYARSANTAKEAVFRRLAAEVAIRNGGYADAMQLVQRASEIVAAQPETPERLEQELELALLLGSIQLVTDGQGSATAKATYDRARALAKALPPGPAVGRAVFGLWTYYLFQGLMGPTAELADEAVALTERSPDPGVQIMAHLAVSQTHMWTGRWDRSVEHFERVLVLYEPERHQQYITQYAQNPRFTASNSGFWSEWMLGHPERAAVVSEEAIAEAKALEHEFTYTIAFLGRPLTAWFRRRFDDFDASVGDYVETAARSGNPFYIAFSLSLEGAAKVLRGEVDDGLAQLEAQYAAMGALGSKLVDPLIVTLLAEGYLTAGRPEAAAELLDRVMPEFERDGRVSFQPDHLRLRAEALVRLDPAATDEALAMLDRGIAVAKDHLARSFQLRDALAAARILRDRGRTGEARARVAEAYATFTEGFDDPDLVEARAWLG